jgi:serine/threonine protein kinase
MSDTVLPPDGGRAGVRDRLDADAGIVPALSERYIARSVLGRGGKATVYLADDRLLSRQVAVKVFKARAAETHSLREQEAEAQLVASLNHHALTTLFDAGVDASDIDHPQIYLVMEYIPGADLRERLRTGPLEWFQVCWLGRDLAEGLQYLHESGFLHRDIKPANVLLASHDVDVRPRAKLTDFGISSLIGHVENGDLVTGSAAYLSPEQVEGADPTPASDTYALGLVLLEALTGRTEYPGGIEESAFARLDRQPRIPSAAPEPIARILTAMTSLDPSRRPPLTEVAAVFQNLLIDDLIRQRGYLPASADVTERARLAALADYNVLDTEPDDTFDAITRIASQVLHTPIALVTLIDEHRVWFKSALGWDEQQVDRDVAFCSTTNPGGSAPWTIPDAELDDRTRNNPLVTSGPQVRSYAGAPLITRDGHNLGALCVFDREPRTFTSSQIDALRDLAGLVMHEMEMRLATRRALFDQR